MAPCSNVITPKMIRRGQVQIGDKIELEDQPVSMTEENPEPTVSVSAEAAVAPQIAVETMLTPQGAVEAGAPAPEAAPVNAVPAAAEAQSAPAAMPDPAAQTAAIQTNAPQTARTVSVPAPAEAKAVPAAAAPQTTAPQTAQTAPGYIDPNRTFPSNTASIPLIFQHMTDYVNPLAHTGQQSPRFGVPSNPLVPPEYEQSIDYDSAQYMNGFLRTQIGRAMRVEQLIGSNGIQDRYGFLVGVGNNYLLLQDISNGNIAIVDLYSVKYVYVYFNDPVFPGTPFTNGGR